MAKAPKKKAGATASPSPKPKEKKVRSGTVTFGKGVTIGRGVK